ncbi:MAG: VanZ family protein [Clostridia bacterium]|nr:VanZ family protein [Clostridia bacterium]
MARTVAAVAAWILTVAWMVTIFMFSAQPAEQSSEISASVTEMLIAAITPDFDQLSVAEQQQLIENWHDIIRKIAHLTEYAVLGVLLTVSLVLSRVKLCLSAIWAAGVSLLYAASDEIHQMFIESRGPGIVDVGIDFVGALIGITFVWLGYKWFSCIAKNKKKSPNNPLTFARLSYIISECQKTTH